VESVLLALLVLAVGLLGLRNIHLYEIWKKITQVKWGKDTRQQIMNFTNYEHPKRHIGI
jgi:Tfp pilus assembly protein PilV